VGDRPLREFPKTSPVVTHGVALKHWQHARASAIDNGDSRQEGGSHIGSEGPSVRKCPVTNVNTDIYPYDFAPETLVALPEATQNC
jgi:hypothetical protein